MMVFLLSEILEKSGSDELDLLPQNYFDTDIYKASKELKKMQKSSSNYFNYMVLCRQHE